jgi:hypothetical protein
LGPSRPIGIDLIPRPQPIDLFDRIGAIRKGAQIEIAGRPNRAPAGIFAFRLDHAQFCRNLAERRNIDREPAPQLSDQILAQEKPSQESLRLNG